MPFYIDLAISLINLQSITIRLNPDYALELCDEP